MRGSLLKCLDRWFRNGIIPAHAGLTSSISLPCALLRDHPRACGAHVMHPSQTSSMWGSSPRMRGSLLLSLCRLVAAGIIPAHAGLTFLDVSVDGKGKDHPRACGAHLPMRFALFSFWGSSPRMRGSQDATRGRWYNLGIIPAHAGLTIQPTGWSGFARDHPRACGAHYVRCNFTAFALGSSPRMRGSPDPDDSVDFEQGIIPAHAGLTLKNPNIDAILSGPHPIFYSVLRVIR